MYEVELLGYVVVRMRVELLMSTKVPFKYEIVLLFAKVVGLE